MLSNKEINKINKVLFKIETISINVAWNCSVSSQIYVFLRSVRLNAVVCQAELCLSECSVLPRTCAKYSETWHLSAAAYKHICGITGSCEQRVSQQRDWVAVLVWPVVRLWLLDRVWMFRFSEPWPFLWPGYFHKVLHASLKHFIWTFDNKPMMNIRTIALRSVSERYLVVVQLLLFPIFRTGVVLCLTGSHPHLFIMFFNIMSKLFCRGKVLQFLMVSSCF